MAELVDARDLKSLEDFPKTSRIQALCGFARLAMPEIMPILRNQFVTILSQWGFVPKNRMSMIVVSSIAFGGYLFGKAAEAVVRDYYYFTEGRGK